MPQTTSYSGPPEWMTPYYQQFLQGAFQTANRPYQQYQGPRVAGMSTIQQGALGGIQGAMGGSGATNAGYGLLGNIISGNTNPASNGIVRQATDAYNSATSGINDRFANPNSFGNARHQMMQTSANEALSRGLTEGLGNLSMQAVGQASNLDNSRMSNYMSGLTAGNVPRQIQQQQYDTGYQDYQNWWNYPTQQTSNLGGWLGMGGNYQQQTQQTPDPNRNTQIAGGLLAALPALYGIGSGQGWF